MLAEAVSCNPVSDNKTMAKNPSHPIFLLICSLALCSASIAATNTKYISDEFEVTLRNGTSTANSIVRMLKSGQIVTVLENDLASKYSLVETEDGKTGYVLSRFLLEGTPVRKQLKKLTIQSNQQQQTMLSLKTQLKDLKLTLDTEKSDNERLKKALLTSQSELTLVKNAAENTLSILADNHRLQAIEQKLRQDQRQLSDENARLKDSTKKDWFIRGSAVSLIAFLLGIAITRIRWKKQDAWAS